MRHRIAICAVPIILLLGGCSVAEYRQMYFPGFQPTPAPRKIDAAVAIETTASGFGDANMTEAFRQVVTEDLASLFQKPITEQRSDAEFLLRATLQFRGLFPPSSLEATVTLLEPKTETKIVSFTRTVQDSTFLGDVRMRQVAGKLLKVALPGLKEDLVRTFDSALSATRRAPLLPFPGSQADR